METEAGIKQFFREEEWSVPMKQEEFTFNNHSFRIDVFSENNTITNENIKIEFDDTQNQLSDESYDENEDVEVNYCQHCKEIYENYCLKCKMLSRILDTPVEFNVINRAKKTLPKNIFEIKSSPKSGNGIFALTSIPDSVIFGPFHGLSVKDTGSYCSFNITKLKNVEIGKEKNSNWMRYINLASDVLEQNLRAFQYNNAMYFQSTRQIDIGEELLIFYEIDFNSKNEKYYKPPVEDVDEDIYACVFCCLGFSARKHLINHKKTCSSRKDEISNKIVHCSKCQLHLSEDEFFNGHEVSCARIKISRLMLFCSRSGQLEVDLRKFKCPKCNYTTSCLTSLQNHYNGNQHQNYEILQEPIKPSKQIRKSKTVDEQEEEEGEEVKKKFKCPKCDVLLSSRGALNKHKKLHGEKKYVCLSCDKKFARKSYLTTHEMIHSGEKRFFCAICNFGAIFKAALESHIKNVHFNHAIEKTYECNTCPFKTNALCSFKRHSRIHLGVKEHTCDVCEMAFQEKGDLTKHKLKHTDERNFLCSQCEKTFQTNRLLEVHVFHSHTEKPYECDHCNFKSKTKENFDLHMKKRHPDGGVDKKFKCTQCKYQTNDKGNYNKHVNNHNGFRPFLCEICKKGFLLKNTLRIHMRGHTGEKDYICHNCGKSFTTKQTLERHLTSHTGDKRLKCSLCDFQTNAEKSLYYHSQRVHPTSELIGNKESANCTLLLI